LLSYRATPAATTKIDKRASLIDAWSARIQMRLTRRSEATAAVHRRCRAHCACSMLYSEGVRCGHALLLHLSGGDRLDMDVQMKNGGARALLTKMTCPASCVGASLAVMREDLLRMRGAKPFAVTDLRRQPDLAQAIRFIETQGLTRP
jgi:hypothetical protein